MVGAGEGRSLSGPVRLKRSVDFPKNRIGVVHDSRMGPDRE